MILLASRNAKKLGELRRILAPALPAEQVVGLDDVPAYPEVPESGATFADNALIKAREGFRRTGLPTVADDSGLCVDALNGMPGVLSARWSAASGSGAEVDAANVRLMLAQVADVPDGRLTAHFACAVAYVDAEGEIVTHGAMPGRLVREARGANGFGYDPVFVPDEQPGELTGAELDPADKDAISHRGRALRALAVELAARSGAADAGTDLRAVGVVLAGGTGIRFGSDRPKQLLEVAGRTLLEHTVAALNRCAELDEIVVVMAAAHVPAAEQLLLGRPEFAKLTRVLPGGADRNASTRAALDAIAGGLAEGTDCNVLLHDAVRPLVTPRILTSCVEALRMHQAVDVVIPSADTIVTVDDQGVITGIPDRAHLRRGQTPQCFRLSVLRRAYDLAARDPDFQATDDCGVVRRFVPDVPIFTVAGNERNIKITYPVDLDLAARLFELAGDPGPAVVGPP